MLKLLYADMARAFPGKSKFKNLISSYLLDPGFKCVVLYRIQHLFSSSWPRLSLLISSFNLRHTGAQFCVGAVIGKGLIVRHPAGIVIGGGVVIGDDCILAQGVTIGQSTVKLDATNKYPKLGNRISIGSNAILIGDISIGDDVTIGAMTFVKKSIESGLTVVGNPSRVTKKTEFKI